MDNGARHPSKHMAEQGESNAKVYGSILPFVPVCKSPCAAQQQVPCTAKRQGVRLLCAAPRAVKSTVSETAKGQVSVLTGPVLAAVSVGPCGSAPWQQAGYKHLSRHKAHAPPEGEKLHRVVPSDVQWDLKRGSDKHLLGEYTEKKKHTDAFCTWSTQSKESANG